MKKIFFNITILLILIFTNCTGLAIKIEIIPNYYLIALDSKEDTSLSYQDQNNDSNYGTLIDATVISVGFNDKFMIIKQKPQQICWGGNIDTISYYILPIKKGMDWKNKNELLGPFSFSQFQQKKKELKISSLLFNKSIYDLK